MIKINEKFINDISEKAKAAPRGRMNYNFHATYDETVQRMLNAVEPGTYIRPHKHENPDKIEVFLVLRGRVAIVEFDETGKIIDHIALDAKRGSYAVEIPPRVWHSLIALEKGSVLYEVKQGPYEKISDKNFASWAPEEGSPEATVYNEQIVKSLRLK